MKVEFRTHEYEWSHGKQPRGYGYWAFSFPGTQADFFWFQGSYSDAKKAAKDEARRRNFAEVKVMP